MIVNPDTSAPARPLNPLRRWRAFTLAGPERVLLSFGFAALATVRITTPGFDVSLSLGGVFVTQALVLWLTLPAGRVLFRSDIAALMAAVLVAAYGNVGVAPVYDSTPLSVAQPILMLLGLALAYRLWKRQQPALMAQRHSSLWVAGGFIAAWCAGFGVLWLVDSPWRELLHPLRLYPPVEWALLLLCGRSLAAWLGQGGLTGRWSSFLLLIGAGPALPVMAVTAHLLHALSGFAPKKAAWLTVVLYVAATLGGLGLFLLHQQVEMYGFAVLLLVCAVLVLAIPHRGWRSVAAFTASLLLAAGMAWLQ